MDFTTFLKNHVGLHIILMNKSKKLKVIHAQVWKSRITFQKNIDIKPFPYNTIDEKDINTVWTSIKKGE